ncbi:DUF4062 domain-containing protein (plasmid) [Deinococcus wulumuqiensis]|uniref:DUF4062 domain-containing protein n=1 Tax=Deinococcus wulumuqiensis TaxID=980427 RepID=A0A345IMJ1_9DEIO|nr:DUF4062 domain-containing protein [Deinococcus wulumuqiensis]AXH00914.1 DUF4062 domain-containing protein [Deinococcus wulumuqiensis]
MTAPNQLLLDLISPLPTLDDRQLRQWANGKTVMISSTMADLQSEREAVAQTIADFGAIPRYFERFSSPGNPAQVYHPEVSRADVYLFIAGERYGQPDPVDPQRRSATHIEYDTAYQAFKPVLAYNKTGVIRETSMTDLVGVLEGRHTVSRFQGLEDLKAAVREGLKTLAEAQSTTWVKLGDSVFPVTHISFAEREGNDWEPQQQRQPITMTANLRDPQIIQSLGRTFHSRTLTLPLKVLDADEVVFTEESAGRFDVTQKIKLVARPAQTQVQTIIPISNGESGEEQLAVAMDSLLFGITPASKSQGGHSFLRPLRPVAPRLDALYRQLSAHHRDAELFVPMAELLLTDRLLRGTAQDPAPLTQITQLVVSPVIDSRMFIRVQGVHHQQNYGGPFQIAREGLIDFRGQEPRGIDSW